MKPCTNCIYNDKLNNLCYVYSTTPTEARKNPHMCGPEAKKFRSMSLRTLEIMNERKQKNNDE